MLLGGRYRLKHRLGEGAAGVVWAADSDLFGAVAVKSLHPQLAHDRDVVDSFVAESRAASAIRHPNVVRVFDLGRSEEGVPFLVMELCEGETLAHIVELRGAVGVLYASELAVQILSALRAAHAVNIVHRDLKPANILVTHPAPDRPLVKVLDFGISTSVRSGEEADERRLFGTPSYMAPEQIALRAVDQRADLYSWGAVLYELLTGRPPFTGATTAEIITQVISRPPMPIYAFDRSLPRDLDGLVRRCLAKNPADRPPNAEHVRLELTRVVGLQAAPVPSVPALKSSRVPSSEAIPLVKRPESEKPLPLVPRESRVPDRPTRPTLVLVEDDD